jgi:hypothetical protein
MKKNTLFAFMAGIVLSSCGGGSSPAPDSAEKRETDLQKERIAGDVVSVRQRVYWVSEKFGRLQKGKLQNMPAQDFLKTYEDGFLTEETHYDASDNIVSRRTWTYGKRKVLLGEASFKGAAERLDSTVYAYNDGGQLIAKITFDAAGAIKEQRKYTYYPSGLLMDEDVYQGETLSAKWVHLYNEWNLPAEKQQYWGGGSLARKEYYEYNDVEELIDVYTEKYQNKTAVFGGHVAYSGYQYHPFGKAGNYTEKIEYNEDGREKAITYYTYDEQGNQTYYRHLKMAAALETIEPASEEPVEVVAEEASPAEDEEPVAEETEAIVAVEAMPADSFVIEEETGQNYRYEYEANNNWIQKITYKYNPNGEDIRQFYYERVITYKD